jgi:hypothetical protein
MFWGGFGQYGHIERKVALIVGKAMKGAVLYGGSLRNRKYKEERV